MHRYRSSYFLFCRPRLYYKYLINHGTNFNGFVQYSLSQLPTEAWHHRNLTHAYEEAHHQNVTKCYYQHYRHAEEERNFAVTQTWWEITCFRLATFCMFIAVAYGFQWLYDFLVPDVPADITLKMQRRRYVVSKAMEAEILSEKWLKPTTHDHHDGGTENGHAQGAIPEIHANGRGHPLFAAANAFRKAAAAAQAEICDVESLHSQSLPIQNGHAVPDVTVRRILHHQAESIKTTVSIAP